MENKTSVAQELIGLEKKYWQSMQDHDLDTALKLTDFPCIVTSSHGVKSVEKDEFIKMFENHQQESIHSFEFNKEPEVRLLNENTAIVAYEIHAMVTAEGKKKPMDAIDTSTWIKRGGKWVCALHTETERMVH